MGFRHSEGRAHLAPRDRGKPSCLLVRRADGLQHHHVAVVRRRGVEHDGAEDRAIHGLVADRHADPPDPEAAVLGAKLQTPQALALRLDPQCLKDVEPNILVGVETPRLAFERDQAFVDEGRDAAP